jgi:hypothetical protein
MECMVDAETQRCVFCGDPAVVGIIVDESVAIDGRVRIRLGGPRVCRARRTLPGKDVVKSGLKADVMPDWLMEEGEWR